MLNKLMRRFELCLLAIIEFYLDFTLGLYYDDPPYYCQSRLKAWIKANLPLIGLFILAAILRVIQLGDAALWYDEAITGWFARLPIPQLITATAGDTHPPLYYLIVWIFTRCLGSSEWVIRLPSYLASLAALVMVWVISGKLQFSRTVRLVAFSAMALSPFELHFAQEGRMYALLQLEVLICWCCILDRRWWGVFWSSLAMLYTHNYGLVYLPVLALLALGPEAARPVIVPLDDRTNLGWKPGDEANFRGPIKVFAGALLLWTPWAAALVYQMQTVAGGYWITPVNLGSILYALNMLFWAFALPEEIQPLSVLITMGLLSLALWEVLRHPKSYFSLALLALGPLALAVLGSLIWKPMLLFRGLAGSVPALYLWLARVLTDHKPVYKQIYAAVLVVPVMLSGLIGYYRYNVTNKGDTPEIVQLVREQYHPGDLIYHLNDGTAVGWMYYGQDMAQAEIPTCQPDPGGLSEQTRSAMGIPQIDLAQSPARRVWIVWGDGPTSQVCEQQAGRALTSRAQLVKLIRDDPYVYTGVWLYEH